MTQLVLVSGLSGSGKSVALKALEDAGFFSVDNLPAPMLPQLVAQRGQLERIAVAIDVRVGASIGTVPETMAQLRADGVDCRVIFLEASDEELSRRFAETRRPHPLANVVTGGVEACIRAERILLAEIAESSHRLDTSGVNSNTLRGWIKDWLGLDQTRLTLAVQSFGFKHGIPMDADLVFDARFLPNPYYDLKLRPLSGRDAPVRAFLEADLNVARFIDDITSFIVRWLPMFVRDNRSALTIAVGCTGGQHRSVYIVEQLSSRFGSGQQVLTRHRDMTV